MADQGEGRDLLGEWWVANPTDAPDAYELPEPEERVPGTLQEVSRDKFVLETIGFIGSEPSLASGPIAATDRSRPEIWGTDRDATCYSLFDSLRASWTRRRGHASAGHEDWSVGWLAKGNVWVTSNEECRSARIRIDHLNAWALYRAADNIEFDGAMETATIDLRDQALGSTMLGDTSVSLVRMPYASFGFQGQDLGQRFSYTDDVYWELEGPLELRSIVKDWIGHFESFVRFMTMEPSVVLSIECHFGGADDERSRVELSAPRLERDGRETKRDDDETSPYKYLTTLRTLQDLAVDPMDMLTGYWQEIATGDAYMAMALHLESQDRLQSRGADGALLNAIRSVESLYAAENSGAAVENVPVQDKIDDAVHRAGTVGAQILDVWPVLRSAGVLRRDVAHGKGRPSAGFGLRCLGGAMSLQWIQRTRLLTQLGIGNSAAQKIVSENFQYPWDLQTLQGWSAELGEGSAA